jgi:hypothetical protein
MNIVDAINDPNLFGRWFKDAESWSAWLAFLSALFGLPMSAEQMAIFASCTGRKVAPITAFGEATLIIGRRGGKSFVLAVIAVFLACFRSYTQYLGPGERATVLVVAADRRQARVIFRYVRGLIAANPMLAKKIERETSESIDLSNSVTIEVGTASHRSVRGYAVAAGLCDELAFWQTDDAAEPDYAVLDALRPGMATIPTAVLLCASSPYAKRGALHDSFKNFYGRDDAPVLVWKAATRVMNPTVPQSVIDAAIERDPSSAAAEYGAEFRSDIADFIARDAVLACVDPGVRERPPKPGIDYFCHVDPSGGSVDSMATAVAHREDDTIVVDCLREIVAPFDPESAVDEFVNLYRSYGIGRTNGDRYAAAWCSQAFEKRNIEYRHSELPTSALYLNFLPHLNSKTVRLLDIPRAVNQICALERRTSRGGRDSVDHPPQGHDDLSAVLAGVTYIGIDRTRPAPVAQTGRMEVAR